MSLKLNDIAALVKAAVVKLTDKDVLAEIAEVIKEDVKKRTRLGRGVPKSEGPSTLLKPLEPSTKRKRRYLKSKGKLTGPGATPAKSGLNQSGQMLDSLEVKTKDGSFTLTLDQEGLRKAEYVEAIDKQRFTFMNLSKGEVQRIIKLLEIEARKALSEKS